MTALSTNNFKQLITVLSTIIASYRENVSPVPQDRLD